MQNSNKKFIFFIVFVLLGIILAVQFRSTLYENGQKTTTELKIENLKEQLDEETNISNALKAQIDEYMTANDNLIRAYIQDKSNDSLMKEWEKTQLIAGLIDVKGPGIVIKLDDAAPRQGEDARFLIIHDQDVRIILNQLKIAGAQAISINGERIVATSEQLCAGPIILINKNRYAVPYTINAIGDPDVLYDMISSSERIGLMVQDNIRVEIKKSNEVVVPKFSGDMTKLITGLEAVEK